MHIYICIFKVLVLTNLEFEAARDDLNDHATKRERECEDLGVSQHLLHLLALRWPYLA